jgi:pyruvate,water dikinase
MGMPHASSLPQTILTLALVALLGSCGDNPGAVVRLELSTADGAAVVSPVVLVDRGSTIERLLCTAETEPTLHARCDGAAVVLTDAPATVHVTVKMRGYRFVSRALMLEVLPMRDGTPIAEIVLERLPPFERNDDYATGFAADGAEAFEQMSLGFDTELGPTRVVKFYIGNLGQEPRVYFQNTKRHFLHYEFCRNVLGLPFVDSTDYLNKTYLGSDRTGMAGTLVRYSAVEAPSEMAGRPVRQPLAVTFFPSDDLTPEQAVFAHRLIEERLGFAPLSGSAGRIAYVPAGQVQEAGLSEARKSFARADALWLTREELFGGLSLQILNAGLAFGTLRRLTPEQMENAVVSHRDILVLSRLPNSLPIVGGTITEELQTPLAHVNVSARARGTPNIALTKAGDDARVAPLLGKLVRFEVTAGAFDLREATPDEAQAFWDGQTKEPIVPAFDAAFEGLPAFDEIGFADSVRVGAKAANLAELSQLLGDRAPHGFAIPFHYYDRFVQTVRVDAELCELARDDCVTEGRDVAVCRRAHALCLPRSGEFEPMRAHIERLLADANFAVDSVLREAVLDNLRHHIRHIPLDATFAAQLDARVIELFGATKIRLRSSTNAEDLPEFSGAGLYESVSAYAEVPGDRPSEEVRKVWASIWNWRAFEERSFWNVDHLAVRMGVAVNQAFPDEAANGVLITQNISDPTVEGMYVNVQRGEVSVTNPEGGAVPEVFSLVGRPPVGVQVTRLRWSSLSPERPILTEQEIVSLYGAAVEVQQHFAPLYGVDSHALLLDLEFKFHGPERALFIKQARPYVRTADVSRRE